MKKLKFNKKFQPCPKDEDDELYANGIFVFNITKLLAFIRANADKFPREEVEVKAVRLFPSSQLTESTILAANLSAPIILAEISPGNFNVIDGNHRLERAHRDGMDKIPAFRVNVEQHLAFLTSEKAYKTYIEYWNGKVDTLKGR
ncbi:MAG: ParB N-terminal domain-containing protein [Bdellovibrio sp.]|nr:ParB N-terminal domain-containing protein [Bdellovibrio sp.]